MPSLNLEENWISFRSKSTLALTTVILTLMIPQIIDSGSITPLQAQTPSVFSDDNVIPMCLGSSLSFIPVSTIGMVNCPVGTFPIVMITSPLSVSSTSSNFIWVCTYTISSEFGFLGFSLAPRITPTDCIPFSSQLSPLLAGLPATAFQSQLAVIAP